MSEFRPVRDLADFRTLNTDHVTYGIRYGAAGHPEPINCTRSFWHGWRMGAMAEGLIPYDEPTLALRAEFRATEIPITEGNA